MKKTMLIALMIFVATGYSWAATYSGGDGSDNDPYQIANANDLIKLSNHSEDWDKHFILTADITFDANEKSVDWDGDGTTNNGSNWDADSDDQKGFSPIGHVDDNFTGNFNGQKHKISNLYINRPHKDYIGLFGSTDDATIENIGIVDCNITGANNVSGLVGVNDNSSMVSDSYSTGGVSGNNIVGGLVGVNDNSSMVSNSYSTCEVSGDNTVGGLVGQNFSSSTISNSYFTGTVSSVHNYVGGLVGQNYRSSTVRNSYSTGEVSGVGYVGGLVGVNYSSTISNSYSTCEVSGTGDYVGGLVGYNKWGSTVHNSYSTGAVSGGNAVGGLVGENLDNSTISDSYSKGNVTRKSGSETNFGGFCGYNESSTIEYCYSTGKVLDESNNNLTGKGFVGYDDGGDYTDNFFDSDVSEQNSTAGDATGKTTENMKKQSTFPNWKFGQNENWTMDPDLNEGYPAHQWADKSDPSVESFSPEDEATDIELAADLVITFDETVVKGTGNITLYKSDGTKIKDFDVTSDKVTIDGAKVTINPSSDLADGVEYYVQIAGTCFKDVSGNDYAGIDDNTTWNFTTEDITSPIVSAFSPGDNSRNAELNANLVITFNETVVKGNGNITLYKSDGTKIKDFDITSDKVTINGAQVTINLDYDLNYEVGYYVQIKNTCFKDAFDNFYVGIDDNTTWNFTGKFETVRFKPADGTDPADIRFAAAPTIDANKTINFIGFQLASNYEMTQNLTELKDEEAEEKGYIFINWNNYTYGDMYYCRYAVRYADGTEDYGPVFAFIKNEGTGVIKIGE